MNITYRDFVGRKRIVFAVRESSDGEFYAINSGEFYAIDATGLDVIRRLVPRVSGRGYTWMIVGSNPELEGN